MNTKQSEPKRDSPPSPWRSTQYSNLIRYVPSGKYFARFRVKGKLIWKTLKTDRITVAQLRLADLEKEERAKAERGQLVAAGKVVFGDMLKTYRENGFRPAKPRTPKDKKRLKPATLKYYEERAGALLKSWSGLETTDLRKITERDCEDWAEKARADMSATTFNHTLGLLRNTIDFWVHASVRYDNPALRVIRESEVQKRLTLPTAEQFEKFVAEIRSSGSGWSKACAEPVPGVRGLKKDRGCKCDLG